MSLSHSHWYPGSGVVLNISIPDLCTLAYFKNHFFCIFEGGCFTQVLLYVDDVSDQYLDP